MSVFRYIQKLWYFSHPTCVHSTLLYMRLWNHKDNKRSNLMLDWSRIKDGYLFFHKSQFLPFLHDRICNKWHLWKKKMISLNYIWHDHIFIHIVGENILNCFPLTFHVIEQIRVYCFWYSFMPSKNPSVVIPIFMKDSTVNWHRNWLGTNSCFQIVI